ncbi:hypothetical protein D1007_41851 [Hordeum vulgare]|nr:hypothetical protein D1007_41851 [Hordeum vulgare]
MEEEAPGLRMTEAEEEFAVARSKEMAEQQAIIDFIWDETEVEAKCRLIRQRQAEADTLFDGLNTLVGEEPWAPTPPRSPDHSPPRKEVVQEPPAMQPPQAPPTHLSQPPPYVDLTMDGDEDDGA